jgi:hypothetical protein
MSGFGTIIDWLRSFWSWVETGFLWLLHAFIALLQFVFFTILDGVLSIVEGLLSALDFSSIAFSYAASWSSLPTQLIWFLGAVGLPQCFALLGAAYLLRLLINLIPSWATRV